nr:MAG TPA: hypothetical protein [Caudoviricetes sp.]
MLLCLPGVFPFDTAKKRRLFGTSNTRKVKY